MQHYTVHFLSIRSFGTARCDAVTDSLTVTATDADVQRYTEGARGRGEGVYHMSPGG